MRSLRVRADTLTSTFLYGRISDRKTTLCLEGRYLGLDKNTSRVKLSAQMSHELLALIILLENKSDIPQTTYNERFDKNKYIMNVDNDGMSKLPENIEFCQHYSI